MPALDFTEIPSAKASKETPGEQDTFELFARDVLEHIGFKIISQPNRGPDQGKDIVIEEIRRGVGGESKIRWLVSCKHYANMGRSVNPDDEVNILERTNVHKCDGFLGFYSTLQSTGLASLLEGQSSIGTQVYDRERIERTLLGSSHGITIAKRYFPESMRKWAAETGAPADLMVETGSLLCDHTRENLLLPKPRGIIVLARSAIGDQQKVHFEEIYWCLKGEPDRILESRCSEKGLITAWEDIPDVIMPPIYLKWCLTALSELHNGYTYSEQAFAKLKQFLICTFPYAARNLREDERERIKTLMGIPAWIGGLG
jgi:hypothetical protein